MKFTRGSIYLVETRFTPSLHRSTMHRVGPKSATHTAADQSEFPLLQLQHDPYESQSLKILLNSIFCALVAVCCVKMH
jgi:hypothetical protein